MNQPTVIIVGAGIAGLCTAIGLTKQGISVKLLERSPELVGLGAGLVLGGNAWKALDRLGLAEILLPIVHPIPQMSILNHRGVMLGSTDTERLGETLSSPSHSIHRKEMVETLKGILPEGVLEEGVNIQGIQETEGKIIVRAEDGRDFSGDLLIGADGIHSVVRQHLFGAVSMRYGGYTCWRGVVPFPRARLEKLGMTETWGPSKRFGIVPLSRDRVYWFAVVSGPARDPNMRDWSMDDLQREYAEFHPDVVQVLAASKDASLLHHDLYDFEPLSSYSKGNILLIGDAAHAMTPNMGQGAGMSIEDAATWVSLMSEELPMSERLRAFDHYRVKRCREIVKTSWMIGRMAHIRSVPLQSLRNVVFRLTPPQINNRQMAKLYDVQLP
ncbi:FAD-dependent oxidoreductase [Pontibacter sp. G13]|uniref:FAD-dependent oxidoreductase n=1 Tax=Pontibacter sp. G13 TaxID=3074898 RepID=UPI00288AC432|nr:FAD-dependent oxidoreductase [Pontibacter sp. G13]WNJ21138.1 FAD-dependent oxidoreductase [Pontibacter sp. G13]